MSNTQNTSELSAVFATTPDHQTVRVSDPLSWDAAQSEWTRLDDLRREGLLPQTKFFEVRSVTLGPDRSLVGPEVRSHGRYDRAPMVMFLYTSPVTNAKGFKNAEDAARAAWLDRHPTFLDRGTTVRRLKSRGYVDSTEHVRSTDQGRGGWFYYSNGATAAQGLDSLAKLCLGKGLVVKGQNGRYYPVAVEVLS